MESGFYAIAASQTDVYLSKPSHVNKAMKNVTWKVQGVCLLNHEWAAIDVRAKEIGSNRHRLAAGILKAFVAAQAKTAESPSSA